jgi:hypothetical protein
VFGLAIDPANPDTLYAGTQRGVFRSSSGGGGWAEFDHGMGPSVVRTLAIEKNGRFLLAGTEQGVFDFQFVADLRPQAQSDAGAPVGGGGTR